MNGPDTKKSRPSQIISGWFWTGLLFLAVAAPAQAYDYEPLEPFPMVEKCATGATACFISYVGGIYNFFILGGGIAALGLITYGGIMYFLSAGNMAKVASGKEIITNALFGLAIILLAWLILNVINPDLLKVNIDFCAIQKPS